MQVSRRLNHAVVGCLVRIVVDAFHEAIKNSSDPYYTAFLGMVSIYRPLLSLYE